MRHQLRKNAARAEVRARREFFRSVDQEAQAIVENSFLDPIADAPLPDPSLPDSLKIGHKTYEIRTWPPKNTIANGRDGECDHVNNELRLREGQDPHDEAHVLLHEVFHALWHTGNVAEGDDEERTVSALSAQFAQVLRDNPALIDYLAAVYR